jgi:hypothetical protein
MAEAALAVEGKPASSWFSRNWIYAPLLLGILIMLPRLLNPSFGLMDDGRAITISQGLLNGKFDLSWDVVSGRARPIYWLAFAFWYILVGGHPFWYFLGNLAVFSITTFLLIYLVRSLGGTKLQACLTGLVFVLSTSVIENIYTLSKAENFQVMLMVSAITICVLAARSVKSSIRWMLVAASILALLVACLTKESTILLLPISLVWWGIGWLGGRKQLPSSGLVKGVSGYLVLSSLVSGVIFYLGRTAFLNASKILGVGQSSGFSFSPGNLVDGMIRWGGWLLRDYLWLFPMLLVVLIACLARRRWPRSGLWWLALVWMAFWLGMYIPWRFAVEYYLMPFAAGTAVLSGVLLAELVDLLKGAGGVWKGVSIATLSLTGLLLLVSQGNSYTDAAIQLAQDSANTRLLEYIAENASPNAQVVVNLQIANEYIEQMQLMLANYYHRPDLTLVNYQGEDLSQLKSGARATYFVTAELGNQPKMTVRMGLDEPSLLVWNASVQPALDTWHQVFQVSEQPIIVAVNFPRLLCRVINRGDYCAARERLFDPNHLLYRWSVYTP